VEMRIGFDVAVLDDLVFGACWETALRWPNQIFVHLEERARNEVLVLKMIFELCFASYTWRSKCIDASIENH
jgi:hypothetical protein